MNTVDLKVGDKVGVVSASGWGLRDAVILSVRRRTATQITLDDGSRWTEKGRQIGIGRSAFNWSYLVSESEAIALNEEARIQRARKNLERDVRNIDPQFITNAGLQEILSVAKANKKATVKS